MYIKLTFSEKVIMIPGEWGGLVVALQEPPIIMVNLPDGVKADTAVNIKQNLTTKTANIDELTNDTITQDYDYYLDCGQASLEVIEKAIAALKKAYEGNELSARTLFSDPLVNPIILQLKSCVKPDIKMAAIPPLNLFKVGIGNFNDADKNQCLAKISVKLH